jgi:hypothetical protein
MVRETREFYRLFMGVAISDTDARAIMAQQVRNHN